MSRVVLVVIILLTLVGIAVLYISFRSTGISADPEIPSLSISGQPTSIPSPTLDPVPSNWVTYTSEIYEFMIRYPTNMQHDTLTEGERFLRLGSTQTSGTELFDGISVVITSGETETNDFRSFVESQYETIKNDATQPQMSDIMPVTIAGKEGYMFEVNNIGKRRMIYLPREENKYIEITDSTVEPSNRPQTYGETVNLMLSSLIYE